MLNQHLCKEECSEGMRVEDQSNKLSMRDNGIFLVMEQGNICTALQSWALNTNTSLQWNPVNKVING